MVDLVAIYRQAVESLGAQRLAREALAGHRRALEPAAGGKLAVFALGKPACALARGAAQALGESIVGLAVGGTESELPPNVKFIRGSHPVPDQASLEAGEALMRAVGSLRFEDAALFLIGGGGSAMAVLPAPGLSLADKRAAVRSLVGSGAPIEEINAVRKHLSGLKGGRVALGCRAGRALTLALCDIPSIELAAVASGPTAADATTYADCLRIIERRSVSLPEAAQRLLERGARGAIEETPKPGDPRLARFESALLASPIDLARRAGELARAAGLEAQVEEKPFAGPIERLADRILEEARKLPRGGAFVIAGEPTLRVPEGAGSGGRMQQLALMLASALEGSPIRVLCAGSDGRDGRSEHAGAVIDGQTASRARGEGVDLSRALRDFDSAAACDRLKIALPTFDSGTNLCDLVIAAAE